MVAAYLLAEDSKACQPEDLGSLLEGFLRFYSPGGGFDFDAQAISLRAVSIVDSETVLALS